MDVSIIIPCFNHAPTLERAVMSALRQTGVTEVIVVDDASSDNSVSLARDLAAGDGRVHPFLQEDNRGPGASRNQGVAQATGIFISFLDADDELMDDFIGAALPVFQQNPELIVAKCEMEFFDPVKGYILPIEDPRHQAAILSSSCGMLMRREHFLRMGGFSEDPVFRGPSGGEDVAFMQAVMAHFQPIARIEHAGYRVWSRTGTHLDKFLANTRLKGDSFEFVDLQSDRLQAGLIDLVMEKYLATVAKRLSSAGNELNS